MAKHGSCRNTIQFGVKVPVTGSAEQRKESRLRRDESRKWLNCDPGTSVGEIAELALSSRLGCIPQLLEKAAFEAKRDVEHVHRLRVATRRADAALQLFGGFAKKKAVKRCRRHLHAIRKAAGRARDLDVLMERQTLPLPERRVESLHRKRKRAQKHIKKAYRRYVDSGKFVKWTRRLLRSFSPDKNSGAESFETWSQRALSSATDSFLQAWPADSSDLDAMHAFRIQTKGLRYVMELVASAVADPVKQAYSQVKVLQTKLGVINDHRVACKRVERALRQPRARDAQSLVSELDDERAALQKALEAFEQEWSSDAKDRLGKVLRGLVR